MNRKDIFASDDALSQFIDTVFNDQSDVTRMMNENVIWRNLLYYCGEQWLEYVPTSGSFRKRLQLNNYVPTPVSNEIREYCRSIKSLLMNQKMAVRVWPNTGEKEDRDAAEIGEQLLTWMDFSQDERFFDEKEKICLWLAISGTAFMRVFPDAEGGMWIPGTPFKTGDVGAEAVLPFNVRLDTLGDTLEKKRWAGIFSLKDREWVEDTFRVKLEKRGEDSTFIDYQKRLATLVANVSPWKGRSPNIQPFSPTDEDVVLFREIEFKPTLGYPRGKYAIQCAGKVIFKIDSMPIQATPEQWYYSLTDFHYNYVPGRFWSDPGINDLISPQNIVNETDQALSINMKGLGRPTVIVPGEVGLKRLDMSGHGFLALTYNPIMGQKPSIEQGVPLPQQVLEYRRLQKEQIQDSGGDPKNILRGAPPSAQSSGIQIDNLRELAERGKSPDIDRFNRSLSRVYKKRLLLAQQLYTEERLIKVTGKGNQVKIMRFKASDLRGNTDVRLELDSSLLTTRSGQAQMLLSMMQSKWLQDPNVSPAQKEDMYQRLGLASFTEQENHDIGRAEDENLRIQGGDFQVQVEEQDPNTGKWIPIVNDPLFEYDSHPDHYEVHRKYIISPDFRMLSPQIQTVFFEHTDCHRRRLEEQKPDLREYLQVDKLLAANVLTPFERGQILADIGVEQDPNLVTIGIPTSDNVMQTKQRLSDTQVREQNKRLKIMTDREVQLRAIQAQRVQGRREGDES